MPIKFSSYMYLSQNYEVSLLYISGGFRGGGGGVREVQMHPPLAASNVFLRT